MYIVQKMCYCVVFSLQIQNGQTALELAEEIGNEDVVEEIKKHSSIADSKVYTYTCVHVCTREKSYIEYGMATEYMCMHAQSKQSKTNLQNS